MLSYQRIGCRHGRSASRARGCSSRSGRRCDADVEEAADDGAEHEHAGQVDNGVHS